MLQLLKKTIARHKRHGGVQPNAPVPPAKASPAKSPGIFAAKGPATKGKGCFFGVKVECSWRLKKTTIFHDFSHGQKKTEPEFLRRLLVLEVADWIAGNAPKPPQTYAERLQKLDRIRW